MTITVNANHCCKYSNGTAQQGQMERMHCVLRRLWLPLYGPCMTMEHSLQPDGISCMLFFFLGGKNRKTWKFRRGLPVASHVIIMDKTALHKQKRKKCELTTSMTSLTVNCEDMGSMLLEAWM